MLGYIFLKILVGISIMMFEQVYSTEMSMAGVLLQNQLNIEGVCEWACMHVGASSWNI